MPDLDKAISDMKCAAVAMLVLSILSGNLAVFITGIVGASYVICCSSNNHSVVQNTGCLYGCAIACAILAGLHAVGMIIVGAWLIGLIGECTDAMTDTSCKHLDYGRRLVTIGNTVAGALNKISTHVPLLLGIATGGTSLIVPGMSPQHTPSLGGGAAPAFAATPLGERRLQAGDYGPIELSGSCSDFNCFDGAHINGYDITCETGVSEADCVATCCAQADCKGFDYSASDHGMGPGRCCTGHVSRVEGGFEENGGTYRSCEKNSVTSSSSASPVTSYNDGNLCRDHGEDCCWGGWESDEPLACDSGYKPELTGGDCFWGFGQTYECTRDDGHTTRAACESHIAETCSGFYSGSIIFFFMWMLWETIGTIVYAVTACKAAKVTAINRVQPAQEPAGTQMQHPQGIAVPVATAAAIPAAVAQPSAGYPQPTAYMPQAVAQAVPVQASPPYGTHCA
jgi:hypothetical protein